eukprot:gene44509-55365_t
MPLIDARAELRDFARSLDWMHPQDCSVLNVGHFLCALAASLDELQIFQWLFAEKIADRDVFRVGVDGFTVLHLAASCNSYVCVKWLVFSKLIDVEQPTESTGQNSAHIAAIREYQQL